MRYLFQVGRHVGRMGGGSGSRPWLRPLGAVSVCCLVAGGAVRADPPEPPPAPRTPPTDVSALPGELPGGIPSVCEEVGTAAERENGIPPGLLLAIGRVESGRWDAGRGRVTPWPWTINAAGKGQWFETREDAIRTVNALREAGTRSIDVGCFQVNLFYHPKAFADLDQAFTPAVNASYAARFLVSLAARTSSWVSAVEAYHSNDPVRGANYRQQVYASWNGGSGIAMIPAREGVPRLFAKPPEPAAAPNIIVGARVVRLPGVVNLSGAPDSAVRVWTPMPSGTAPTIVSMPPPAIVPLTAASPMAALPAAASPMAAPMAARTGGFAPGRPPGPPQVIPVGQWRAQDEGPRNVIPADRTLRSSLVRGNENAVAQIGRWMVQ